MATYRMSGKQFTAFVGGIKAAGKKATLMAELAAAVSYQSRYYGNFDAIGRAKSVVPSYAGAWFDQLDATLRDDHKEGMLWKDAGLTIEQMDDQIERYVSIVMDLFEAREKERTAKKELEAKAEEEAKKARCLLVRGEEEISVTPEEMRAITDMLQKMRGSSLGVKGNVLKEGDSLKAA
jgi:hypothetical protein